MGLTLDRAVVTESYFRSVRKTSNKSDEIVAQRWGRQACGLVLLGGVQAMLWRHSAWHFLG